MRSFSLTIMLFVSVALSSCVGFGRKVEGNGNRQTRDYSISNFTEVSLAGSMTVYITQGSTYSVKVEADENLFEYLKIEKDGNELEIGSRNNYNLRSKGGIKVFVTSPTYEGAEVAGSGKIISQSKITNARVINIDVAGSGDIKAFDLMAEVTKIDIAGSGNAQVSASRELDVDIAGSGDVTYKGNPAVKTSKAGSGEVRKAG